MGAVKKICLFLKNIWDSKYFFIVICCIHICFSYRLLDLTHDVSDLLFTLSACYFVFAIVMFDHAVAPLLDPLVDKLSAKFKKPSEEVTEQ